METAGHGISNFSISRLSPCCSGFLTCYRMRFSVYLFYMKDTASGREWSLCRYLKMGKAVEKQNEEGQYISISA